MAIWWFWLRWWWWWWWCPQSQLTASFAIEHLGITIRPVLPLLHPSIGLNMIRSIIFWLKIVSKATSFDQVFHHDIYLSTYLLTCLCTRATGLFHAVQPDWLVEPNPIVGP
ncbi:hypothetical protein AA313_de0205269 [Arthrobotrys entomopaga]|nr:hypothetical protein AA313_de0205269 [Arthrobotrys entomopaga]